MSKSKSGPIRLDIYEIAKKLKLPDFNDDVYESNIEYISEAGYAAEQEVRRNASEDDPEGVDIAAAESAREKAEQAAGDELFHTWQNAVESAADEVWGFHHLAVEGKRGSIDYTIEPVAGKTWYDVAAEIARSINGVGVGYVPPEDYARAPRRWVEDHMGLMHVQPEVYGTASAERIYERSFR